MELFPNPLQRYEKYLIYANNIAKKYIIFAFFYTLADISPGIYLAIPAQSLAIPAHHAGCKPLRRAPLARPDRLAECSAFPDDSRPVWADSRPAALAGSFGALGGSVCYSAAVSQPPRVCEQQQPLKKHNNQHTTTTSPGDLASVACSGRFAPFSNATSCESLGALRVLYGARRAFCLSSVFLASVARFGRCTPFRHATSCEDIGLSATAHECAQKKRASFRRLLFF